MVYAIGIPTFGREAELAETLSAIMRSTLLPSMVFVVDNNDSARYHNECYGWTTVVSRVPCDFRTRGPEQGHQTALRYAVRLGIDVMVRWDDDLVPNRECLEKLVRAVSSGSCIACGGMYPREGEARTSSPTGAGDGNDRHLQFFGWSGEDRMIVRKHLYSSFAYDVRAALEVGGFCPDYSRYGQRGETDMTLRLGRIGRLAVDTSAVAVHKLASGGRRTLSDFEAAAAATHDNALFTRRMIEYGIDPEAW